MPDWLTIVLSIVIGSLLGACIGVRWSYTILLDSDEFVGRVAKRYWLMMDARRDLARAERFRQDAQKHEADTKPRVVKLDRQHRLLAKLKRKNAQREQERLEQLKSLGGTGTGGASSGA